MKKISFRTLTIATLASSLGMLAHAAAWASEWNVPLPTNVRPLFAEPQIKWVLMQGRIFPLCPGIKLSRRTIEGDGYHIQSELSAQLKLVCGVIAVSGDRADEVSGQLKTLHQLHSYEVSVLNRNDISLLFVARGVEAKRWVQKIARFAEENSW